MFQEHTIIFLSQNINLYPGCMQFCKVPKERRCAVPTAAQDWIMCNKKYQRNSLVSFTGCSVDEGY